MMTTRQENVVCAKVGEGIGWKNENINQVIQCSCGEGLQSECTATSLNTATPTRQPSLRPPQSTTASPTAFIQPDGFMTPYPTPFPSTRLPVVQPTEVTTTALPTTAPQSFSSISPEQQPTTPTDWTTALPWTFPPTTRTTPTPTFQPTQNPTISSRPTLIPFDKPSISMPSRTPPSETPRQGCYFPSSSSSSTTTTTTTTLDKNDQGEYYVAPGEVVSFANNNLDDDSYSTLLQKYIPCTPLSNWPIYCYPENVPYQINYPYCVFSSTGGPISLMQAKSDSTATDTNTTYYCAKSGDRVQVPSTATGTMETCSCLYLNPKIGPVSSCPELMVDTTPLWMAMTTTSMTMAPSTSPFAPQPADNNNNQNNMPTITTMTDNPTSTPSSSSASKESSNFFISKNHCHFWTVLMIMMMSAFV